MDWYCLPTRFLSVLILVASAALAGCSGSTGVSSDADGDDPPTQPHDPANPPSNDDPSDSSAGPQVSLSASDSAVAVGGTVTLTWSATNANSCTASGGWSGTKATSGSAQVGPLDQSTTFTLSCQGPAGNALAMLAVDVLGNVILEWEPPTENVDGSPLTDLAGYRIYYGEMSGNYTDELPVDDATATAYQLTLPSGSYFFAMTALDSVGNESAFSNEVFRVVN